MNEHSIRTVVHTTTFAISRTRCLKDQMKNDCFFTCYVHYIIREHGDDNANVMVERMITIRDIASIRVGLVDDKSKKQNEKVKRARCFPIGSRVRENKR